jgi:N-acetylglucosaminyldiphosphoundecaprenol N-acetyl-beta-D-mannosaminyltransferase
MTPDQIIYSSILGLRVDPTSYYEACVSILCWASNNQTRMVCVANVHLTMTAYDDPVYRAMINAADLVTPDGMPLVWTLRLMGNKEQERVYGPTLTEKLLPMLAADGVPIGFLGGTPEVLEKLQGTIQAQHPEIKIVYTYSPPFRQLTGEEDQAIVAEINQSGARVLFVGLGCPKQEIWMHAHRDQVQAVMLGGGAAFDFIAGTKSQAPLWVQRIGMEWFYRLLTEPKRLWQRYFYNNPRFVVLVAHQLIRDWLLQAKK